MLKHRPLRALLIALACALIAPASAAADGTFIIDGPTIEFTGDAGVDQIAGFDTGTTIRFTRFGGADLGGGLPCVVSPDQQSVDCPKGGITSVVLNLGGGNDVASVTSAVTLPVFFNGGDGADGMFGGGGVDSFDGGPGNDNIVARDGRVEGVECASGIDTAITDDGDNRVSCEQVEGDADGDGVRRPADCDDTNPGLRPGAVDVFDDNIDQDCSGTDATNRDRDGDGFLQGQDCNDGDPAIRPNAREIVGNPVDENCDRVVAPLPPIAGSVANAWLVNGSRTRNLKLAAENFPRGTRIAMRCSGDGCPFKRINKRVKRRKATVGLHRHLGDRSLREGARLELRFSLKAHVGRVLRYRMRDALPDVDFLCRRPGGKVRGC